MKIIYSFIIWILLSFMTVFLVMLGAIPLIFGKNVYFHLARLWAKLNLILFTVRYEVEGMENIDPEKNYVFMGNHQSYVDIFLLIAIIDKNFLFMAKEELFKIPFFGFAIRSLGLIPINRGESRDALKSLFEAAKKIQEGYSVLLFPEGTRNNEPKMLPFKRGAFTLAVRTGLEIAPFILEGTGKSLPKKSFIVNPFTRTKLRFIEPVNPKGLKDRELLGVIRQRMEDEQEELRSSWAG